MAPAGHVTSTGWQRAFALLLAFGAVVLLYRSVSFAFLEGGLIRMTWAVSALGFVELLVDLGCLTMSIRWAVRATPDTSSIPLRLGALATLLHFVRVAIFALGRTEWAYNFDVRPEYHSSVRTDMFWVWFALTLAVAGVIGVGAIWFAIRRHRRRVSSVEH